ncbi:hypothetical protein BBJ28_00001383 [Nothophytophthora sp. Chile5]|nr:hypothetical protein BBJ28_00001383 [Nothophytophthora sp. Chile5]
MQLRTQYLLLLFVFGVIAKGLVKSIYDDIARQQAESAAKLDALHGVGDGRVTELGLATRKTHFTFNELESNVITERMHKYSSKLGGSRRDRQKFLRKNSKTKVTAVDLDINDPAQVAAARAQNLPTIEPPAPEAKTNKKSKNKKPVETIVEEAVDATL